MASIYLRNGTYQIQYLWKGRKYRRSLDTSNEKEALRLKRELERRLLEMADAELQQENVATVRDLAEAYVEWAADYYHGAESSLTRICIVVDELMAHSGALVVSEFGPLRFRELQQRWIDQGLSRRTVNHYTGQVKHIFKWAVSHEKAAPAVYQALATVEGLRKGRSAAYEPEPKRPVLQAHIDAVRAVVPSPVRALIDLQLLTAARPGELVFLRACDIDRSGAVWVARPQTHKGSWIGKDRTLFLGPRAQEIILPFIRTRKGPQSYLFSPVEAQQERFAACETHRHQPVAPTKTDRVVRDHYGVDTYRRAIQYACKKAGVPVWTPHRLRHTAATRIRKAHGLEAAQVFLGHSHADVTQIYAQANQEKARQIAEQMG